MITITNNNLSLSSLLSILVLGHLHVLPGSTHLTASMVDLLLGIASIPVIILWSLDRLHVVLQPGSLGQVVQSKDGLMIRR